MGFVVGDQVGDYSITGVVGSGGSGQVFKVEHRITGRVEAMKVLLEGRRQPTSPAERFQREIKLQASLNHPNIASVHNAFWVRDELVMIMELVDGQSLDQIIDQQALRPSQVLRVGVLALRALEYAHARGITHRDIKPENIMIAADGAVKLMDFGLAKDEFQDGRLTQTGAVVGSLFYISPEQAQGLETVDHRSDIYSLGSVLFELATGRKVYPYNNSFELLQAAVNEPADLATDVNPEVPESLSLAIQRAMAKRPEDRFADAQDFRRTLELIVRDPTASSAEIALPKAAPPLPPEPVRKRKMRLRVAALVVCLATVGYLGLRSLSETPLADQVRQYQQQAEAQAAGLDPAPLSAYSRTRTLSLGGEVRALAVSPDAMRVLAAVDEDRLELFDVAAGRSMPLDGHAGAVSAVAFSPDSRLAASGGTDRSARIWSIGDGSQLRNMAHADEVISIAFSSDGEWLATGSADGAVRVWNLEDAAESYPLPGRVLSGETSLEFSPIGNLLAVGSADGVQLWAIDSNETPQELTGGSAESALRFSENGLELAGVGAGKITVWDMPTRDQKWSAPLSRGARPTRPAGGRWLLGAADEEARDVVRVLDARGGEDQARLAHDGEVESVRLSVDAQSLAAVLRGGDVVLWAIAD